MTRARSEPRAVSITMAMPSVRGSRRSSRQMVTRSRSGRFRSRITKRNPPRWTASRPSWPFANVVTSYPSRCRFSRTEKAMSASSSISAIRCMLDHGSFDQIYDHLADVRRVVRHPLEVFSDKREADGRGDVPRVFQHVSQERAERVDRELVDDVVLLDDLPGKAGVVAPKGVERLASHLLRVVGQPRQLHERLHLRLAAQLDHPLADLLSQVGDPLPLPRGLPYPRDDTEAARPR